MKVCSICRQRHEDSIACVQTASAPAKEIRATPEDLIPGFRLTELISAGPSEQLHRGREASSGRSCLIRIVETDPKTSDDIIRDSKTAAGLFHPSIAGLFEAGLLDEGRCFVVSEDLDGKTLRDVLDNVGSPDLLDSIEIVRETAEALQAFHAAGLIHGAVNPGNIVLSKSSGGEAKVKIQHPDLGRAKQRAIISNRFLIDSELAALRYFSPEQCTGADPSVQCDVYGLGVVFYEMLAGRPPFEAPTAVGLIHQQQNVAPPEIKVQNFNLRMLVTHALTEALQKPVRLRQSSANVFARQLRHIEQLATHSSAPPPAGTIPKPAPTVRVTPSGVPSVAKSPGVVPAPIVSIDVRVTPSGIQPVAKSSTQNMPEGGNPVAAFPTQNMPKGVTLTEDATLTQGVTLTASPIEESTPIAERAEPIFVTPRSRLKLWKKKWRTIASRIATETESQVSSILESGRKRMAAETSISSLVEPAARPTRRKIEWETPDDDIPTVEDVREAVAPPVLPVVAAASADDASVSPPVLAGAAAASADGVVPLADIVISTVESKLPLETAVVPPEVGKPIDEVATPTIIVPKPQPVKEVHQDAVKATRIAAPKAVPVVSPVAKEKPIEMVVPTRPAIRRAASTIQAAPKVNTPAVPAPGRFVPRMDIATVTSGRQPRAAKQRSGLGFKVNLADLEEITIVRPPSKRIKIDWERVAPVADTSTPPRRSQTTASQEIVFSPTILGSHAETKTSIAPAADEMFSAHADAGIASATLKRAALIGGGVVALLALMLFGNASITSFYQASRAADSTTVPAVPNRETPSGPIAAAATAPNLKITKKERPVAKDRFEPQPEPAPVKAAAVAPKAVAVAAKSKVASPAVEKSGTPKPRSEVKLQPEKKPVTSRDKMTRPRVVKDPKH